MDLERDVHLVERTWKGLCHFVSELLLAEPVRGVVGGRALEIALFEVEVLGFALSAKLRIPSVELFVASSEALLVPAANNDLTAFARAQEHLLKSQILHEVRDNAKGVHAHAVDSKGSVAPEI